jgi:hypothetical protein
MKRNVIAIIGVVSIIVLAVAIFFRPAPTVPESVDALLTPEEELDLFMHDNMNYGIRFSIILAEKRIERAREIGKEHPGLEEHARAVADSLRARLDRRAIIDEHRPQ